VDHTDTIFRLTKRLEELEVKQERQPEMLVQHVARVVEGEKRARQAADAELEGSLAAIPAPVMPDSVDLSPLYGETRELREEIRQVSDLASYLYDAPSVTTVIREIKSSDTPGTLAVTRQHMVRPMGSY
jgi:hypothetical protein